MDIFEQKKSLFNRDYSRYQSKDKEWLKEQIWMNVLYASSYDVIHIDPKLLFEMIDMMDDYRRGYSDGRSDALNEMIPDGDDSEVTE
jgi:hypothetical protein